MRALATDRPAAVEPEPPPFEIRPLEDGAVFVLDRPTKLNALTAAVVEGLEGCIDDLEAAGQRLVVIVGRGEKAFSAGTDVRELQSLELEARLTKSARTRSLLVRLARSPLVSVAAINGLAFGGGLEIAMACTLRLCAPHATFALPEVRLGLVPAYAGTQFLPALIGPGRALDMMLTGRVVAADEALAMGLIHRIASPSAPLLPSAIAYGRDVTRHSPEAVGAIRRCVEAAVPAVTEFGLATEDECVRAVFGSPDAREGVAAFLRVRSGGA